MLLKKLIVSVVGFDEKLVLRPLLRVGYSPTDSIIFVYSKTGSDYDVKKVESAVKNIKDLLSSAGAEFFDVVTSGMDFVGDVSIIVRSLKKAAGDEVVGIVSGGMRITSFETLLALQIYKNFINQKSNVKIHIEREDGLYSISLPLEVMNLMPPPSRELESIKLLSDGEKLDEAVRSLSSAMGVSRYTAYKLLYRLRKRGLITIQGKTLQLTISGKLIKEALRSD